MINSQIYDVGLARFILLNGGLLRPLFINLNQGREISCMNPSVLLHNDKLLVNLRVTNYFLWNSEKFMHEEGPVSYCHETNDPNLRSENYLMTFDKDLNKLNTSKIELNDSQEKHQFIGLEDVKLVNWDGVKLLGSRRDDNKDGKSRMHLVTIDENFNKVKSKRLDVNDSYLEKNWIPILDKPNTYIRHIHPLNVVEYDDQYKDLIKFNYDGMTDLRGSSQLIPVDNHYIAIVHTTEVFKPYYGVKNGIYKHYFIKFSKNLRIMQVSDPFNFIVGENIEFCNGLAYDNGYLFIPFSTCDNVSYIAKIEYNKIFNDE